MPEKKPPKKVKGKNKAKSKPEIKQSDSTDSTEKDKKLAIVENLKLTGNVSATAEALQIDRQHIYYLQRTDEIFKESCKEALKEGHAVADDSYVDIAEHKLIEIIKNIDVKKPDKAAVTALLGLLNNKGKKRGYGKHEEAKAPTKSFADTMKELDARRAGYKEPEVKEDTDEEDPEEEDE
jgi:hypothetical protein